MAQEKVLIVDDEVDNLSLLRMRLEAEKFEVFTAESGKEGIEKAKRLRPDIIILDVNMPGMDGFETCRRLKENIETAHIPVVMLTCLGTLDNKLRGLDGGADDYLVRDEIDYREISARLRSILRRASATISANPLTHLPGNVVIDREIKNRLESAYGCRSWDYWAPCGNCMGISCDSDEYHGLHAVSPDVCTSYDDLVDPITKEPVDSDILITDNLHSIYSLEKDFSPLLTAFRKQIQNKKAGYFFSAEYVERKLFDAFFDTGKKFAVIKNENRLVDKVSLNRKPTDINLNGSRGNTIITVGDGSAFVKSSSCRHKLCEHAGQAFSLGDVIACAPNKVLIKIEVG